MLRIGIYYICTGPYKGWFPGFLESLKNFLPGDEKHLKIISDGLDDYHDYSDEKNRIYVDSIGLLLHYLNLSIFLIIKMIVLIIVFISMVIVRYSQSQIFFGTTLERF